MTVYAYIRVSTTEQVDNTSMQEQRRQCKGNAMAHGHSIDRFVEDGGVSGAEPFMERLERHGVTPGKGDVFIVAKLDRFSRDARDALNAIHDMKAVGAKLIINGNGDVTDDSNITARLMLEVMAVFAGHERPCYQGTPEGWPGREEGSGWAHRRVGEVWLRDRGCWSRGGAGGGPEAAGGLGVCAAPARRRDELPLDRVGD
jgi:hypothetical protein